jgi:hypothetical protein
MILAKHGIKRGPKEAPASVQNGAPVDEKAKKPHAAAKPAN